MPTPDRDERPDSYREPRRTRGIGDRAEKAQGFDEGDERRRSHKASISGRRLRLDEELEVLYLTRESLEGGGTRIVQLGVRVAEDVEILKQGELARRIRAGSRFFVLKESQKAYLRFSINERGLVELDADTANLDLVSEVPPCGKLVKGKVAYEVVRLTHVALEGRRNRVTRSRIKVGGTVQELGEKELARHLRAGGRLYVLKNRRQSYFNLAIGEEGFLFLETIAIAELAGHLEEEDQPQPLRPPADGNEFQVTCITRRPHEFGRGRIVRLGVRIGETIRLLNERQLLERIRAEQRFYVLKDKQKVYLRLAISEQGQAFVETIGDATLKDNLDETPQCPPDAISNLHQWGVYIWLAGLTVILGLLVIRSCVVQPPSCQCITPTPTTQTPPPGTTLPPPTTPPLQTTMPPGTTLPPPTTPPPQTTMPPGTTLLPPTTSPPQTTIPPGTTLPPATTPPPQTTIPPVTTLPPVTQLSIHHPKAMVSDPMTDRLFVGSLGDNSVVVVDERSITATSGAIDLATIITTVRNITVPFGMGILHSKVFVAENGSDSVGVIDANDPAKPAETIKIENGAGCRTATETHGPSHLAVNPLANHVYVALHDGTGQVAVIDAETHAVSCLDANAGAFGIAANPKFNQFYVGDRDAFDLRVYADPPNHPPSYQKAIALTAKIDPNAPDSARVPVSPYYLAVSPDGTQLYVAVATNCKDRATEAHNCDKVDQLLVYAIDDGGEVNETPKMQVSIGGNTNDGGWILQSVCSPNKIYIAETNDGPDIVGRRVLTFSSDLASVAGSSPILESQDGGEPFSLVENPRLGRIYVGYKYYQNDSRGKLAFDSETPCR